MKIYEKPMAIIEKINVEDVITASKTVTNDDVAAAIAAKTTAAEDAVILFQW